MMKMLVNLNSIDKVKLFVAETSKHIEDMDLISDRYVIDAKSIMGVFSLDLSRPIKFVIHSEDKSIMNEFEKFRA